MNTAKRLTEQDFKDIEARAKAATPGPWWRGDTDEDERGDGDIVYSRMDERIIAGPMPSESDASFIAHAREDIPALLREVDRLNAALASAERGLSQTIQQRDYYQERVDDIARRLGCEHDLGNVHAHASCIEDAIGALEMKAGEGGGR